MRKDSSPAHVLASSEPMELDFSLVLDLDWMSFEVCRDSECQLSGIGFHVGELHHIGASAGERKHTSD